MPQIESIEIFLARFRFWVITNSYPKFIFLYFSILLLLKIILSLSNCSFISSCLQIKTMFNSLIFKKSEVEIFVKEILLTIFYSGFKIMKGYTPLLKFIPLADNYLNNKFFKQFIRNIYLIHCF